jgi:glucose 1-dehydrogenase
MRLQDRVAIVTAVGERTGMGRGIARTLAREGADLVLNSTNPRNVEAAVAEIRALGRRAVGVPGDASSRESCQRMVAAAFELGRLDIVVCNAGVNTFTAFEQTSEAAARRVVDVNFFGTFNLCQLALPALKERGGSIVIITSVHAESAYPNSSIYNFTKAGLNHFAATLGLELARYKIRVNAIEPGWVQTPGSAGDLTEEQLAQVERRLIPWGRVGQAEDIGRAVAFLASDDADYVTSAVLRVDGGLVASAEYKKE